MDELIQADELRGEVRQLLRFRVPLLMAVLVNFAFLVRVPAMQLWAEAAPPPEAATLVPAVASPTMHHQAPLLCPLGHAASQETETIPGESAVPAPSAAPPGVSPFAVANALGRAVQRLVAQGFAPSGQNNSAANSGRGAEPVAMPDATGMADPAAVPNTTMVVEPPAASHAGASPLPYQVDSPPTGLTIRNASENKETVRFLINGRVCELQPGEAHDFAAGTAWNVKFHRGESFGNAQQTLVPGIYRFVVTDQGWDLESHR
ncbi:MAG: hypothetical protein ACYC3X_03900 [Pirellulaceae bacterium]